MSFSETHDVTKPAGSRDLSLGDDDIREYKRAMDERLNVDHVKPSDETGYTTVGYHQKCTHVKQGSNPSTVTDTVITYCKSDGSSDELFAIDESGNVTQITKSGKLAVLGVEGWRSGDLLISSNTNTPTGWTDVSSTYDGKFMRISSGTPLTTGGADTHDHGAATGSHTLTTSEIPAHSHAVTASYNGAGGAQTGPQGPFTNQSLTADGWSTNNTGGGSGHTHTIASANNIPAYIQVKVYKKT